MADDPVMARESTSRQPLGQCPRCAVPIPRALELIEYETSNGLARFAECPTCGDVVRPRGSR